MRTADRRWKNESIKLIVMIVAVAGVYAEMPSKVNVSLPIAAAVGGITLDPGAYTMVIEGFDGSTATIRIFSDGAPKERVSAKVSVFKPDEPVRKTAVKVASRNGSYLLDKLLISGESKGFQFP